MAIAQPVSKLLTNPVGASEAQINAVISSISKPLRAKAQSIMNRLMTGGTISITEDGLLVLDGNVLRSSVRNLLLYHITPDDKKQTVPLDYKIFNEYVNPSTILTLSVKMPKDWKTIAE